MPVDRRALVARHAGRLRRHRARQRRGRCARRRRPWPALQVYVRDLGKGLVMLGGRDSYGAGGYLDTPIEEALPVYMTVRDRERSPDVAMVAVVDKSGSMADCHCTGDSRDSANPSGAARIREGRHRQGGDPARRRGPGADRPARRRGLRRERPLGGAHRADRLRGLGEGLGFSADGNTNIYAGLKAAYDDLIRNPAKLRHIILITDGWSTSGAYDELLADMRAAGITLSTIGTGGGSAQILRRLAEQSGGRYYDAADATTIPDIFLRETIRTAGEQIVEEDVPADPVDAVRDPRRARRRTAAAAPRLQRHHGQGQRHGRAPHRSRGPAAGAMAVRARARGCLDQRRAAAVGHAVDRDARVRDAHRAAGGLDPAAAGRRGHRRALLSRRRRRAERRGHLARRRGRAAELLPDRAAPGVAGPGAVPDGARAGRPGPVCRHRARRRAGRVPRAGGPDVRGRDRHRCGEPHAGPCLARRRGVPAAGDRRRCAARLRHRRGRPHHRPGSDEEGQASSVWTHDIEASAFPTPIWPWLLLLAMLLVPIDVGVRRVALSGADLLRARAWVARRVGLGRSDAGRGARPRRAAGRARAERPPIGHGRSSP